MNTGGILGGLLDYWRCFPLERTGQMPCDSCECFDSSTLECVQPGCRICNDVIDAVRDMYAKEPQYQEKKQWRTGNGKGPDQARKDS